VADLARKSLSNERTYGEHLRSAEACRAAMAELVRELEEELRTKAGDRTIRKAFVKVKFSDFTHTTRECICRQPEPETFFDLLEEARSRKDLPVRLLGSGVRFVAADTASTDLQPELEL